MKQKIPKILKRKNTFIYIDEDGNHMGSMNIATGKFIGATLCMMALYDHIEKHKQTPEYLEQEKSRLEKSIQNSTERFHKDLLQLEDIEKNIQ